MDRKPTLSDLLALRDGESDDAALAQAVATDPQLARQADALARVKADLNALPPVTPDAAVWAAIEERTGARRRSRWLERFPLATAATVFLAAALTIMLWDPTAAPPGEAGGPQVAADPVARLMLRSRHLEGELFTRAAAPAVTTSSEQALMYAIADVDAQLNELYESGTPDPADRERLWRQRVMLLESLQEVQRGQAVMRPAIY